MFVSNTGPPEAMLHPDAMLTTKVCFCSSKYLRRRQCASPAGATLEAEPNLFYAKPNCFQQKCFFHNTGPPEAMLHPDARL